MKKQLLLAACLLVCITGALSQQLTDLLSTEAKKTDAAVRKQIDSFYRVLPSLQKKELVDGLIMLSNKFALLPVSKQVKADSTYKYLTRALAESKKSGYKKGMAHSYMKLAGVEIMRHDVYWDLNSKQLDDRKIAQYLNDAEASLQKAINLGEQINDNSVLGGSYWELSGVAERRVWNDTSSIRWEKLKDEMEKLYRKSIFYTEKQGPELTEGTYRDIGFVACSGCTGNERWLGGLYRDLADILKQKRDYKNAIEQNNRSILYYRKAGEKALEGYMHNSQATIYRLLGDLTEQEASYKKAVSLFSENTNPEWENNACIGLVAIYLNRGEFEKSFPYCERSIKIMEALDKSGEKGATNVYGSLYWMARLYKVAGDYETALQYMRRTLPNYAANRNGLVNWKAEVGDLFTLMGNYDSAMYYLAPAADPASNYSSFGKFNLGVLYVSLKEYDKALTILEANTSERRQNNDHIGLGLNLTWLAKVYTAKKENKKALISATEALALLKQAQRRWNMITTFEVLAEIFQNTGKHDSAYHYLRLHTSLKDSILNRQFYWRLNTIKKQSEEDKRTSQINMLFLDNKLKTEELNKAVLLKQQGLAEFALIEKDNRLKEEQLTQETLLRQQKETDLSLLQSKALFKDEQLKQQKYEKNTLATILLLVLLLGTVITILFIQKRKNDKLKLARELEKQALESEKKHVLLQQQAVELEMQALRTQMNPHFIFNCLSSINRFILKNESEKASDYLTRFSRLIRMVLVNSEKKEISLDDELEMLKLYLNMERMRFKDAFDFRIIFNNTIDPGAISIPPLLLQPFCENAIWHGLMHKEGEGHLDISVEMQDKELHCIITDDGIGRKKAAAIKDKFANERKSMGLKITLERLALFNRDKDPHTSYQVQDLYDKEGRSAGTSILLKIRTSEKVPLSLIS